MGDARSIVLCRCRPASRHAEAPFVAEHRHRGESAGASGSTRDGAPVTRSPNRAPRPLARRRQRGRRRADRAAELACVKRVAGTLLEDRRARLVIRVRDRRADEVSHRVRRRVRGGPPSWTEGWVRQPSIRAAAASGSAGRIAPIAATGRSEMRLSQVVERAHRGLVDPVQVVDGDQQQPAGREVRGEPVDRVEHRETPSGRGSGTPPRARGGSRPAGRAAAPPRSELALAPSMHRRARARTAGGSRRRRTRARALFPAPPAHAGGLGGGLARGAQHRALPGSRCTFDHDVASIHRFHPAG